MLSPWHSPAAARSESVRARRFTIATNTQGLTMIRKAMLQSGRVNRLRMLLLAGTILLPACSNSLEDHPPLYPVKGKVTLDGKPMASGTIIFEYSGDGADAPKGAGGGPFRVTSKIKDGTFNLVGYAGSEGMPAGNYKVGISTTQGRSEDNLFGREVVLPKEGKSAVSVSQYADPKTSGLTSRVSKDEPNEPVFDLK
jgi:hypothetical protein